MINEREEMQKAVLDLIDAQVKLYLPPTKPGSRYEIDIIKEAQRQQALRLAGYKFCPKCGKAYILPKGLENIGSNNAISLGCECGGTIVFSEKKEENVEAD